MATLTNQPVVRGGLAPSYAAAAGGGDKFRPNENVLLHVKNGSGGAITVTVVTPGTVGGEAIADRAVSVPAGGERMIGPFPERLFANNSDSGLASITYSAVTSLTIACLELGEN